MRELDGMRIIGPADGEFSDGARSKRRQLIAASETGGRWSLGEVAAEPDESVATHVHPGEPEAFIIVEGEVELHGAQGVAQLKRGDVVFIPPDTEHGAAEADALFANPHVRLIERRRVVSVRDHRLKGPPSASDSLKRAP